MIKIIKKLFKKKAKAVKLTRPCDNCKADAVACFDCKYCTL